MGSLNEITDTLLNLYSGGRVSDNYRPRRAQLKYIIKYWRARAIRNDLDRNINPNQFMWQFLGCQELELVDEAECCDVETGCMVLRTKNKIPSPVRGKDGDFLKIYTVDKKKVIPIKRAEEVESFVSNQFIGKSIIAVIRNGYAYFYNTKTLTHVVPAGIYEDPTVAANLVDCDDVVCYTDDDEFPMPMDMIQQLVQAIVSGELKVMATTPEDVVNDMQK